MTPFRLAHISLRRHLFATFISIFAIGVSVAAGGVLLRLYQVSESRFSAMGMGGDAIIGAKAGGIEILLGSLNGEGNYPDFLPFRLFESLRAEQAVSHGDGVVTKPTYIESIIPFVYFAKFEGFRVIGTDNSFFNRKRPGESLQISEGRTLGGNFEAVIGQSVAREKGIRVGDKMKAKLWVGEVDDDASVELNVVGVLKPTRSQWDRSIFSSFETAHELFERNAGRINARSIWGPNVLHYYLVYLRPNGFNQLEGLVNKRTVAQVVGVDKEKERLRELAGVGKRLGGLVTAVVIGLGGLAVCAMLITRFEGMALQLAVLRALGYTKKEISKWLFWEGALLGMGGVLLGALFDLLCFPFLRSGLGSALPPVDLVPSSIFNSAPIWGAALMAVVAAVSVPLIKMSNQDVHSSLRGL